MPQLAKTESPKRLHWIIAGVAALFAILLFVHVDVMETANHSYLFLESVFSGRFMHFYEDVMLHENTLYYINNAHYSVFIYLIFGIFELPVFLVCKLFGLAVSEVLLLYIGKLVSALFFLASLPLVYKIARQLGASGANGQWAMLFTALWPPAFFSCFVMGQYDSICLVFILLAVLNWTRREMLRFSLWMGVGAACKFFPLLLVVPLVLLAEKRILPILKYGALTLWLTAPLSLLFLGRDGDMNFFNSLMLARLFDAKVPLSVNAPVFPLVYALLCLVAYMWAPRDKEALKKTGIWMCLAVFGALFLFVDWHPQWLILLAPFVVLTTITMKRRFVWCCVDIMLSVGFFVWLVYAFPRQLEANLLGFSLVGVLSGVNVNSADIINPIEFYYNLFPVLPDIPLELYAAGVLSHIFFKIPGKNGPLAARLAAGGEAPYDEKLPLMLWLTFAIPMLAWLVPTLFTWVKSFSAML